MTRGPARRIRSAVVRLAPSKLIETDMIILVASLVLLVCAAYHVPTPRDGRYAVHGWLILPLDAPAPSDGATPVSAYFVHHTPEYFSGDTTDRRLAPDEFPHDWQLIFLGSLLPLSVDGSPPLPIPLPYPPASPLLGEDREWSITPPPSFSLNNLLNGDTRWLAGTVYNGSFDTTFERIPLAYGNITVERLVTVAWMNASAALTPTPQLAYFAYPRGGAHVYLAHVLSAAPDFDQVIHAVVADTSCAPLHPGARWTMLDIPNTLTQRLLASPVPHKASDDDGNTCDFLVLEELHCVVGPDMGDRCPPLA